VGTGTAAERAAWGERIEDLYRRYAPSALRLAYFLTGERHLAEDLVQDAFVRVAGRFRHRAFPADLAAYLRRAVVNGAISHHRRRRVELAWLSRQRGEPPAGEPADPADRDELWQALLRLPPRQRAALVLRFYEDLTELEAAQILGCSVGALNQLMVRGKAALRSLIEEA
jgi:RNA polymerase sigma-70 factor (sigma-E family)